jgi:hypothetical protein
MDECPFLGRLVVAASIWHGEEFRMLTSPAPSARMKSSSEILRQSSREQTAGFAPHARHLEARWQHQKAAIHWG